jgi:hypothetical protein
MSERPPMPWMFLGGYAVFLLGLIVNMIASMELSAAVKPSIELPAKSGGLGSGDAILCLVFIVAGVAATALGCFLIARAPVLTGADFSANLIIFIMTPLPAVMAAGINQIGDRYRKGDTATWQVILIGIGVFLLALAGSWVAQGFPLAGMRSDYREFAWAIIGNLGCAAVFLAALPLFKATETDAAPPPSGDSSLEELKKLLDK